MSKRVASLFKCRYLKYLIHPFMFIMLIILSKLTYYYPYIPISEIKSHLLEKVNPNLVLDPSKPKCSYDFIENNNTAVVIEIPTNLDSFLPTGVMDDGSYSPSHCNPLFSVALLVTYRNREKQLNTFLPYIHNFLRNQNIHYKIFVIEQQDEKPWNKGSLYNIGAKQAMVEKFPCLILHDVDLLPLDYTNLYACLTQPRHMSAAVDKLRFVLPYTELVGGALAIPTDLYTKVNGFSNRFRYWGGEDDNFSMRILDNNLSILRFPYSMSRYNMMCHHKQKEKNKDRYDMMMQPMQDVAQDGLNSLTYASRTVKSYRLFTLIGVRF